LPFHFSTAVNFGSHFFLLQSLKENEATIKDVVNSREVNAWAIRSRTGETATLSNIKRIVNSTDFWDTVAKVLEVVEPLITFLRKADSDSVPFRGGFTPWISVELMRLEQTFLGFNEADYPGITEVRRDLESKLVNEWDVPIFAAAAILNPEIGWCTRNDYAKIAQRKAQLSSVLRMTLKWQGRDEESHMFGNIEKDAGVLLEEQVLLYAEGKGPFQKADASGNPSTLEKYLGKMAPERWWWSIPWSQTTQRRYGPFYLRDLAMQILTMNCSASACERNWSEYSSLWTKWRNKLSTSTADKLVYVRHSLALKKKQLNRFELSYHTKEIEEEEIEEEEEEDVLIRIS
jgi:hypothetical protein